jgi:hypothetical protein
VNFKQFSISEKLLRVRLIRDRLRPQRVRSEGLNLAEEISVGHYTENDHEKRRHVCMSPLVDLCSDQMEEVPQGMRTRMQVQPSLV